MNNPEAANNDTYKITEPTGWESIEAGLDQENSAEVEALMSEFDITKSSAQFIQDKLGSDTHAGGMGFTEEHAGQAAGAPNKLLSKVYDEISREYPSGGSAYSSGSKALSSRLTRQGGYGEKGAALSLSEVQEVLPGLSGEDSLRTAICAASVSSDETKVPLATGTERIASSEGSENSIALTKMFMEEPGSGRVVVVESLWERGPSVEAEDGTWQNGEVIDGSVTTRPATIEEIRAIQNGNLGRAYL